MTTSIHELPFDGFRAYVTVGLDAPRHCDCPVELAIFVGASEHGFDAAAFLRAAIEANHDFVPGTFLRRARDASRSPVYVSGDYARSLAPALDALALVRLLPEELEFAEVVGVECLDATFTVNARLSLDGAQRPLVKSDARGALFRKGVATPTPAMVAANRANRLSCHKVMDPILGRACECSRHGRQPCAVTCEHARYGLVLDVFANQSADGAMVMCDACAAKDDADLGITCIECYRQICFRNNVVGTIDFYDNAAS